MPAIKIKVHDVIITGAGPAGIAAAIQLRRSGIDFIILEKNIPGGLLRNASRVENYPGFPEGISGMELAEKFTRQLKKFKIGIRAEKALKVRELKSRIKVTTNKNVYYAKYLIAASGTKPARYNICNKGIEIFNDISEIRNVRNRKIIISGGSDAAFDYAVSLSKGKNLVGIIHRGEKPGCIKPLLQKAKKIKNIVYINNTEILSVKKTKEGKSAECFNKKENFRYFESFDIFIAATGREPELGFLPEEFRNRTLKGKSERIFPAGDVRNGLFRQTSISTGEGIRTAMEIFRKLKTENESNGKSR